MIGVATGESIARAWGDRHCQHPDFPALVCVLGFTETALIPGISAAGQTPSDRRITALADGEFLLRGIQPRYHYPLPPLTAGASPALISRALLEALALPLYVFNAGLPLPRLPEMIDLGGAPARCLTTGEAMTAQTVAQLWEQGWSWGAKLSSQYPWLIIAECVVGGTTTALALCESLGIPARDCVGSSHRQSNHAQKWSLVQQGLAHLPANADPFTCVAAIGDPMQVVVAAMALRASQTCGVLLAGGSQMMAVYAFARAIAQWRQLPWCPAQIVVGTTRWLIEDQTAQIHRLAERVQCPLIYTQLDFSASRHPALRAYEQGFVKEGVGAGGCAIAAHLLAGWSNSDMVHIIDRLGDRWSKGM
ncbi:nicotinate mononucleotide-dependent phosphoribosyltransferase CobT [Thermosynechococcus sp. PKX82]|uniref:nicotinate mononucleotide-dependent phosphoribosyltransferase CobT n=1 Tax=Thermosynechococcus sp. PKX82 TaxID=3074086 RepID=UPI0028735439|nr:TIGR00303 family protein [Thermosynechococcus sp. PKX82]WNC29205.1 TIGR00303 family protein [Thermosynechococcus sp. PKX82]